MDLEVDMELTPQNKFRLDINGTTDRLDPKSRSKILNVLEVLSCD